jgi:hypothetical protein
MKLGAYVAAWLAENGNKSMKIWPSLSASAMAKMAQ